MTFVTWSTPRNDSKVIDYPLMVKLNLANIIIIFALSRNTFYSINSSFLNHAKRGGTNARGRDPHTHWYFEESAHWNFFSNISKRISRTKNEIAVPASLHSIRELSAKEKNRRRIEEQREAQHFEYVKRSGSLKHAEIRPQRSAYQGIRYGPYHHKLRLKFAKS